MNEKIISVLLKNSALFDEFKERVRRLLDREGA
jgi:hypothetical protein